MVLGRHFYQMYYRCEESTNIIWTRRWVTRWCQPRCWLWKCYRRWYQKKRTSLLWTKRKSKADLEIFVNPKTYKRKKIMNMYWQKTSGKWSGFPSMIKIIWSESHLIYAIKKSLQDVENDGTFNGKMNMTVYLETKIPEHWHQAFWTYLNLT